MAAGHGPNHPRGNAPAIVAQNMGPGSSFERKVKEMSAAKLRQALKGIEAELVAEVDQLVSERLVTDRTGDRHKKGTVRLAGSFYAVVDLNASPILIAIRSKANQKKVASLEFGVSTSHSIETEEFDSLAWPAGPGSRGYGTGSPRSAVRLEKSGKVSRSARQNAGGGGKQRYVRPGPIVDHPGNRPYRFMRDALDNVIRRRLADKAFK